MIKDMVLMPVELEYVEQVADLLKVLRGGAGGGAGRRAAPATVSEAFEGQQALVDGQPWTQEMIMRLHDELTYNGVRALLNVCAARPGDWVLKSEVETKQNVSPIQLRNELGALSKLTRRIYSTEPIWPMRYRKERGVYSYRLDEPVASWWRETTGAQR